MKTLFSSLLMAVSVALASPASASPEKGHHDSDRYEDRDHPGQHEQNQKGKRNKHEDDKSHHAPQQLPPGLQMNQSRGKPLPPGWQKKLVRGYRIDEDTYQHGRVVDHDDRYEVIHIEDKIYRVVRNTREIVDILSH